MPGTAAPLTRSAEPGGPALCAALGCRSLVPPTGPCAAGSAPRTAHSAISHSLGFGRTWLIDHPNAAPQWLVSWLALATAIHSLELAN